MTAEIHQFPEQLDRLAGKIKSDLERRVTSEAEWVDATLELCVDLAAARAEFETDIGFGQWFASGGFDLDKNDRAAAIAMGKEPDRAREVLTATKRRSIRVIHDKEFRFPNVGKPPISEKRQKALDVYDRIIEAGETPTRKAVQAEAGVGKTTADEAFLIREAAEATELPPLSMTAQQKLDVWQKKLEADFDYRVRMAAIKQVEELRIPALEEKIKKLTGMLSWPQFSVMWKAEYNKIVKCLHPDHLNSRTVEELAEAFDIFTRYKLKFVNDDEDRRNTLRQLQSTMPKSLAEMLARKKK